MREAREGPGRAKLVAPPPELHPDVLAALERLEIERLYSHQAEALDGAWEGPTIVTTGTASGKSLCFNLPTLDVLCRDSKARALYLYPTKALAQDQARALAALRPDQAACARRSTTATRRARRARTSAGGPTSCSPTPTCSTSASSPTTPPGRSSSRTSRSSSSTRRTSTAACSARTSPTSCAACAGSRRPTAPSPRFLLTSATIANPVELAERLTGLEDVALIDADGSPAPGRQIAIWNPPLTDEALGKRRSALAEAAELLARLVRDGARTICFMKSRKGVELLRRLVVRGARAARRRRAGRAGRPLPRRLHLPAAPRARGPPRRAASCAR